MRPSLDLIWIRQDLRLHDNPALYYGSGRSCLLLFTLGDYTGSGEHTSELAKAWLHAALKSLSSDLDHRYKAKIIYYSGTLLEFLDSVKLVADIKKVHWNHSYTPSAIERDTLYQAALSERAIEVETHTGNLLHEPWEIQNKNHAFIEHFSPFQRLYYDQLAHRSSLDYPAHVRSEVVKGINYGSLKDLKLISNQKRYDDLLDYWDISEKAARDLLKAFVKDRLQHFEDSCEIPSVQATSKLSPYILNGQISVRWIWEVCETPGGSEETRSFLNQLLWREFAYYSLFHNPQLLNEPFSKDFTRFPWQVDPLRLEAWKNGQTGYPLIDAGMRELQQTGWIHNRIRLVVSSFLVKNLGISWQEGAAFFLDHTIDADLALNTINWQLVTGCGVDAYPFSRILNPINQGEKFDPEGIYVSHWIPELKQLPERWIHHPWDAPAEVLKRAAVVLGGNYPKPLVDFQSSRTWALDAFHAMNASDEIYGTG